MAFFKTVISFIGSYFLLIILSLVKSENTTSSLATAATDIKKESINSTASVSIKTSTATVSETWPFPTDDLPKQNEIEFIESAGYVLHRTLPNGEQYLLFKQKKKRKWVIPDGLCHKGENASDAALRELHNKTGLTSEDVSIIPDLEKIISKGKRCRIYVTTYFIATIKVPEKEIILSPEFAKCEWMYIKDALDSVGKDFIDVLQDIDKFVLNITNKIPSSYRRT